jgi:hypothetical protein
MLLIKEDLLDIKIVDMLTDIQRIHLNMVDKGYQPNSTEAKEFCKLALSVKQFFEQLGRGEAKK